MGPPRSAATARAGCSKAFRRSSGCGRATGTACRPCPRASGAPPAPRRPASRLSRTRSPGSTPSSSTRKSSTRNTAQPCCAISRSTSAGWRAGGRHGPTPSARWPRSGSRWGRRRGLRRLRGVDSTVTAMLAHRAVGDRLHCIFVDNGVLRKNEARRVAEGFRQGLGIPLRVVDASARFLERLAGVRSPERKRKVIGREFIRVFEESAREIPGRRSSPRARSTRMSSRAFPSGGLRRSSRATTMWAGCRSGCG